MSHKVTLEIRVLDLDLFKRACEARGIPITEGAHKSVRFKEDCMLEAKLPGWTYPVALTADGNVVYDNYNGRWGAQADLDALMQAYTQDVVLQVAAAGGFMVQDTVRCADGSLELILQR